MVVKLARAGSGPPAREPRLTEEERKQLMLAEHRKDDMLERKMF